MAKKSKKNDSNNIAVNKKAFHDYSFTQTLEAGVVLEGWEVKSIRAGKLQLSDSYVLIKKNEAWWLGGVVSPLTTACTHRPLRADRTRKVLLHRKEIDNLIGLTKQKGFSLIPQRMYWDKNRIKLTIGLAKGKKLYDKREASKQRDWAREKARLLK